MRTTPFRPGIHGQCGRSGRRRNGPRNGRRAAHRVERDSTTPFGTAYQHGGGKDRCEVGDEHARIRNVEMTAAEGKGHVAENLADEQQGNDRDSGRCREHARDHGDAEEHRQRGGPGIPTRRKSVGDSRYDAGRTAHEPTTHAREELGVGGGHAPMIRGLLQGVVCRASHPTSGVSRETHLVEARESEYDKTHFDECSDTRALR